MREWLRQHRFLVVFALLACLMGTSVGVAKITASLYAIELGASAAQLGLIASGQVIGTLFMSVPIGFLVDHHGPTRLFVVGSLAAGLVYALVPLVASPAFLLGCLTAVSFFMPMRFVTLNTVFFEQIRSLGADKAGWYRGTHMSGMFLIGPALAVGLIAALGYAGTWWAIAASFMLTVAVCPIVFARYGGRPRQAGPRPSLPGMAREMRLMLRDPELRQTCLIDFCAAGTTAYQTTFIVAIALQRLQLDAAHASAYVTGTGLAFILTLFTAGRWAVRLGTRRAYLTGFALVAVALLLQGGARSAAWLWPGVVLQGAGLGLLQIVTLTSVAHVGARLGQGKVSGVNLLVNPIGALGGSAVGGLLAQWVGMQAVFFLYVPAYAALAWWQLRRPDAARVPAQAPASTLTPPAGPSTAPVADRAAAA